MGLLKLIKYKLAKRQVRLRRTIHSPYIPTEKEEKTIKIISSLIKDEDSVMMVAPNSGKLYIKNDKKSMFVIINDKFITLLNNRMNSYHDIIVHYEVVDKLKRNFKNVLESRRQTMELDMINGVINNLESIAKNLDVIFDGAKY